MKKNYSMTTLLLALLGCALLLAAVFSFYHSNEQEESKSNSDSAIDSAHQKIDVLSNEIQKTKEQLETVHPNESSQLSDSIKTLSSENIPIVEIKNTDLGEEMETEESPKKGQRMIYNHQIKFTLMNIGNYSLKEVIFSIKDIYNEAKDKKNKKEAHHYNYMGRTFENTDLGAYNTIEVNTLNLKTKKTIYVCNLPKSFGVGDYYFDIIVEWKNGFYQMHVDLEEINGKIKYRYQFYDIDGQPINLKK